VDKILANAHDKMLKLSEVLTQFLMKNVPGISENIAEEASILMAKNRSLFATAFKKQYCSTRRLG